MSARTDRHQLQYRVVSTSQGTRTASLRPTKTDRNSNTSAGSTPHQTPVIPFPTPTPLPPPSPSAVSPASSRAASPTRDTVTDSNFHSYSAASDLQAAYGTGPFPGLSSVPPARPKPSSEDEGEEEEEPEVWEYRGNLLTHSALSLVLRQEALALADSSGQYSGDLSWDDLRNCWIPNWAEKLRKADLAEGELPDTNPAGFRTRRKDDWGNRIGWKDGRM